MKLRNRTQKHHCTTDSWSTMFFNYSTELGHYRQPE